jgi:hypothetical protein
MHMPTQVGTQPSARPGAATPDRAGTTTEVPVLSHRTMPRPDLRLHAPAIARRLVELADRLEQAGEPVDVLDALALRNIAAILHRG